MYDSSFHFYRVLISNATFSSCLFCLLNHCFCSYLRRGLGWHFPKVVGFELFTSLVMAFISWQLFSACQSQRSSAWGSWLFKQERCLISFMRSGVIHFNGYYSDSFKFLLEYLMEHVELICGNLKSILFRSVTCMDISRKETCQDFEWRDFI